MIYVCVAAHNDAATIGLVLWKVRQVFSAFRREYQLLVADDGSSDHTPDVLTSYQRVLPLTLARHESRRGWAPTVEGLLRDALRRSDRPKRDIAITIHPNFSVSPDALPDLVKAMESGADLVVAETEHRDAPFASRVVRRSAPWLLRPGLKVPGVRDLLSGVCAIRLSTLAYCLRQGDRDLLETRGPAALAELVAKTAAVARQIFVVPVPGSPALANGSGEYAPLALAMDLFRAGRRLRVPAPTVEIRRAPE